MARHDVFRQFDEFSGQFSIPRIGGFISPALAVVGRPLTPVSVAGVARRSARR